MTTLRNYATALLLVFTLSTQAQAKSYSDLWDKQGEKWTPSSRLPDFSYAGYHSGQKKIPNLKPTLNVTAFGAKPNDNIDDTAAFQKALDAGKNQVIYVPPGKYIITRILNLNQSHCVLKGQNKKTTILYFPKNLTQINPQPTKNSSGTPTTKYSWSGGFIRIAKYKASHKITKITQPAKRAQTKITVQNTAKLKTNTYITIRINEDPNHTLTNYLYQNQTGDISKIKSIKSALVCKIIRIHNKTITIDRPLPFKIKPSWRPAIYTFNPPLQEVGIENLTFQFPSTPYKGHFSEKGYNALTFSNVANAWVKNITIKNADSGFFARGNFCTFQNITLKSSRTPDKRGQTGHHGITIAGQDNLLTNFNFKTKFIHDITTASSRNVITNGKGIDLCFDLHKRAPHANLFSNINIGKGTRIYQSGGGAKLGKNSGAWNTFWNIKSKKEIPWPHPKFAPDHINIIAVSTHQKTIKNPKGKWFETINPKHIYPKDLHQAQLKKRLKANH